MHVSEVLDAVFLAARKAPEPFEVFNVATGDYITVTEIADLAVEVAGLAQVRSSTHTLVAIAVGEETCRSSASTPTEFGRLVGAII